MNKTLRISYALEHTYRVNSILYALRQIPLLRRILPERLYQVQGLKRFAQVLAGIWEVLLVFLGKFLYFYLMLLLPGALYDLVPPESFFLHALLCLTILGAFLNTKLFSPSLDKYYALSLMRMDPRAYILSNFVYSMGKVLVGFLPMALWFGLQQQVPWWACLLIPPAVVGAKVTGAALSLLSYRRRGSGRIDGPASKLLWLGAAVLLAAAYGLPVVGAALPMGLSLAVFGLLVILGALSVPVVRTFEHYRSYSQELLAQMLHQMDGAKGAAKKTAEKVISADPTLTSRRHGFAFLHELFVKRHRKILWQSTRRIAAGLLALLALGLLILALVPESRKPINGMILTWLPYFTFIMYSLNRGTGFTRALFMNCDHSLLTYACFKEPRHILTLFRIRLWAIIKINAVPALILGGGLALLLWASGGTKQPVEYAVLVASILAMSVFFSIHYLTIYYLIQPYNVATELKSGTYSLVMTGTYLVCFVLMQVRLPILVFGLTCIAFCMIYSVVACVLVYRLAPRTFRLRT